MKDLERFLRRLVEVLEARDPAGVHRPIAIDDLRRTILPYRLNRSALGLASLEDYEMLVLRLIGEEGGYVRTFPPESAERARVEIRSLHPDVDLVEALGDATIQIGACGLARLIETREDGAPTPGPSRVEPIGNGAPADAELAAPATPIAEASAVAESPDPVSAPPADASPPAAPEPMSPEAPAMADTPVATSAPPAPPEPEFEPIADDIVVDVPVPVQHAAPDEPEGRSGLRASVAICPFCSSPLPTHREVSFCPYCGDRLGPRRCSRCGSDVEKGWRHCISCGQAVAGGGS